MTDHVDTCVIGAGVVGLAIGKALAPLAKNLLVLDKAESFGQGISSRNSEVIHAGIYYKKGTLKAELCRKGKNLLYEYCEQRKIGFHRCGKLIVATSAKEHQDLERVLCTARENGVVDLSYWSAQQLADAEPLVKSTCGLYSPSTGIVSAHQLMTALVADIEANDGQIVPRTFVESITHQRGKFELCCNIDGEHYNITCRVLVNAAGLGAQAVAQCSDFLGTDIPPLYLCRGNYFVYEGKNPFKHLIYPVPDPSGAGLGVHATLDLGGQVKFGPDVEYTDRENYLVTESRRDSYYQAIKRYFPTLEKHRLRPGYAGIRPKLQGPGGAVEDFVIQAEAELNIEGYAHLFGIESPGLTSSLAIGEHVKNALSQNYV